MEKKQNFHSRQTSSKGLVSESRNKNSDVAKQWPKNGRRRENSNLPNSKADLQRNTKPPSKNRTNVDKRPRPRGGPPSLPINISPPGTGLAHGETVSPDSETESFQVELNSVYSPGSKKQNWNHLLNFHYVAREKTNSASRKGINRGTRKLRYNKEQFLQANCQFVVKESTDLKVNTTISPDALVDWENIEQINIKTTEEPQCPICLYPPVAAKLTRCGHVYCWSCVLHYLALSDKKWRKCPICYDAIHLGDLKSTTILQQNDFKIGEYVTFRLMRRRQGCLFIEKVGETKWGETIPNLSDNSEQKFFTKFLRANHAEILSIIEREKHELCIEDEESPEFVFIEQALTLLKQREDSVLKDIQGSSTGTRNDVSADCCFEGQGKLDEIVENEFTENWLEYQHEKAEIAQDANNATALNPIEGSKFYYFYQSEDGQNIYLHSLNIRMLQAMYGSLENCPLEVKGRIVQKEMYSMTEDLRRRLKYLQHMPLTCQFEVIEISVDPNVVSDEILAEFRDEIIQRQKDRMKRVREEKKRERQINEINDRQMGKIISKYANISISPQEFPSCGFEDFSFENFPTEHQPSPSTSVSEGPNISKRQKDNTPSFAKMLSSPKTETWPTLSVTNSQQNASWANVSSSRYVENTSDAEIYDHNAEEVHIVRQNLGDVLAEALEKKKGLNSKHHNASTDNGNKKGKKNKKMLLFSTGMNFTGN